jgi:hypothetical protein
VRGIDIFKSAVNAIDRYQNPPGVRRPPRSTIRSNVQANEPVTEVCNLALYPATGPPRCPHGAERVVAMV